MTSETISWIIAGIALVSSILSPIIVSVINNRFQIKRDVLIPHEKRKIEIYENYLQCVGKRLYYKLNAYEEEYAALYSTVWLYIPKEHQEKVEKMNSLLADLGKVSSEEYKAKKEEAKVFHSELCQALSNYSQKSKYHKV